MKIFTDKKIKILFIQVLLSFLIVCIACAVLTGLFPGQAIIVIAAAFTVLFAAVFCELAVYFKERQGLIDGAAEKIKSYIAGDTGSRIDADEEGSLYKLFHEINSLASVLNAHADNEKRSKQFLKDTISDISHQLKTPLAALNIYNGLMQSDAAENEEIKEFADLSEKELERIEALVQALLKTAKLDAGTVAFEKSEENVSDMMYETERRFLHRTRAEGKTLSFSGDDTIKLFCDRKWIIEAVGNIVKNALDHTKEGDTIQIKWQKFASIVQITVSDTGCGIHPEDMPHIFKRFYRSRFSKDTQGVGLGLPLAKAVIEAHSGTVEVDSESGAGTVFTINFLIPTKL